MVFEFFARKENVSFLDEWVSTNKSALRMVRPELSFVLSFTYIVFFTVE